MKKLRRRDLLAMAGPFGALAGCGGGEAQGVVVGAKGGTEQLLLAEILARRIEAALPGYSISRRTGLNSSAQLMETMQAGQLDVCPEYLGAALAGILRLDPDADRALIREQLKDNYRQRFQCEWVGPFGFESAYTMVVMSSRAAQAGLKSIGDAAGVRPGWRIGADREFISSADGLPMLMRKYKLPLRGPAQAMEPGQVYAAMRSGEIDMAAGTRTDAALQSQEFMALEDNERAFWPFEAGAVIRMETLDRLPVLASLLQSLTGKLSEERMRAMNSQVETAQRPAAEVADSFLGTLVGAGTKS